MAKWLAITLFAMICFMVILLGLGYFLSENEKSTVVLKDQLAQQTQLRQKKIHQRQNLNAYSKAEKAVDAAPKQTNAEIMQTFETTLINNLTCVTLTQCLVVTVKFKNINCKLASNVIGASQLKKIATNTITMDNCPIVTPNSQLACQQNICSLVNRAD
jgi:preprotein translocase subunit SecG